MTRARNHVGGIRPRESYLTITVTIVGLAAISAASVVRTTGGSGGIAGAGSATAAFLSGGAAVLTDGSLALMPASPSGTMRNEFYTLNVGSVPILRAVAPRTGDFDSDGTADLNDWSFLAPCAAGPNLDLAEPCVPMDISGDGRVDLRDVAEFQHSFRQRE